MKEITFYKKLGKSEEGQKYLELIQEKEHCDWRVRISGFERHHILPKAMGGKDESINLVKLTSFEHVLAHYYLALAVPCYQTLRTMYILSNMTVQKLTDLEKIELAQLEYWGKLREEAMRLPTTEGRMCINNGKRKKYIRPEEFQEYAAEGWKLGNLPTTQGYVTVTDGTCDRKVPADQLEALLQEGWKEGSVKRGIPSGQKGKHVGERNWMTNGVLEKQVRVCDQEGYLKTGWHYGKMPWSLETRKKFSYNLKNRPDFTGKSEKGRLRRRKTGLGRIWMNSGTEDRWVTPDIAEGLKTQGWIRGRSSKGLRRNSIAICKEGERDKIVPQSELSTYIVGGWKIGRSRKGKLRTVYRENEIRLVPVESLEEYINRGWNRGTGKTGKRDVRAMEKDGTVKMVSSDRQKEYIEQGWRYGQLQRSKEACQKIKEAVSGRIWMTGPTNKEYRIKLEDIQEYLDKGYTLGQSTLHRTSKGTIQMYKDIGKGIRVLPEEVDKYVSLGYRKGRWWGKKF